MIFAGIYFILILFLLYKNRFFGIFDIETVSENKYALLFALKALSVPAFYWVFQYHYGGIENFDAGKYFSDSKIINSIAFENPLEYFKVLFGLQDESQGSWLYKNFLVKTMNWDEGQSVRSIFNDNKSVIRFHSILQFISSNSYFVHALITCLMSFAGIHWIVKSFRNFIKGYEFIFLCIVALTPNLWLYTGGVLKEPLFMFNIGLSFQIIDKIFLKRQGLIKTLLLISAAVLLALLIKPFIALTIIVFYIIFKILNNLTLVKKTLIYVVTVSVTVVLVNYTITYLTGKSSKERINTKQTQLYDLMKGGVFLIDNEKFVRLEYDSALYRTESSKDTLNIRLNYGIKYTYWEHSHQKDTLVCDFNKDTSRVYSLVYKIAPAHSVYQIDKINGDYNDINTWLKAIYFTLIYPLNFNNIFSVVVTAENLFLTICFLISLIGLIRSKDKLPVVFALMLVIFVFLILGVTSPNSGAIVRYRSVMIPFLIFSALYTLNKNETKGIRKDN